MKIAFKQSTSTNVYIEREEFDREDILSSTSHNHNIFQLSSNLKHMLRILMRAKILTRYFGNNNFVFLLLLMM